MISVCEAILFAAGEPLEVARIAEALELDITETETALAQLEAKLVERESGICLLKLGNKYQLCSKTEYAPQIRAVLEIKKNAPLSPAAFEVLAVVAYNQPVTKAYVEQIRGVDCSGVISTLIARGLLEEKGRLDLPGRPLLYGTTPAFLRCFCITSLSQLPELPNKKDLGIDDPDDEIDSEQGVQIRSFFNEEAYNEIQSQNQESETPAETETPVTVSQ